MECSEELRRFIENRVRQLELMDLIREWGQGRKVGGLGLIPPG